VPDDDFDLVFPIGTVLRGKYLLDRVLGVGGMAVVYAATHRNQKRFAVKVLRRELSVQPDIRARFLREGYAANTVDHPGAVAVLDDDTAEDGSAFLVMELLDGSSVEDLWERCSRRVPWMAALGIVDQLLDVLAVAHAKDIVHRDIKPANLFATKDRQVKVLDFGIARVRDAAVNQTRATGTGLVLGTPAFMSPEQALGRSREIDARTDVWASGATLYTLISGQQVHEAESAQEVLIRAATTPARSLAEVAPGMPAPIVALVDRALAFDKHARWPSAQAMRDAVAAAHLAVSGAPVSRDSLTMLVGDEDVRFAPTRIVASSSAKPFVAVPSGTGPVAPRIAPTVDHVEPNRLSAQASRPFGGAPPTPTIEDRSDGQGGALARPRTDPMPPPLLLVGNTTAKPVANDGGEPPMIPAGVPRRNTAMMASIALAGALLVLVMTTVGIWAATRARTPAAAQVSVTNSPAPGGSLAVEALASVQPALPALTAPARSDPRATARGESNPPTSPGPASSQPRVAAAARPEREGILNIDSVPASLCSLDGQPLGATPRMGVSVTPGAHVVTFVTADQRATKTVSVTVAPGETKFAGAKLEWTAPAAPRPPPLPALPAKPNCDVPYYVDRDGIQRIRPSCK
jgi:serine/threonine-protein kinase